MSNIYNELQKRILILDGAMGTMLQDYNFSEEDYRGERFKDYPTSLKGNNDLLSLTQPDAIAEIHRKYFDAGADIVETNTFSGTSIAMADYDMENLVYELNYESAKIAKHKAATAAATTVHINTSINTVLNLGSVGPLFRSTNYLASNSVKAAGKKNALRMAEATIKAKADRAEKCSAMFA